MSTIAPDWSLKTSAALARNLLQARTDNRLQNWSAAFALYTKVKRPLIDVLDPTTGRREIPVSHDPPADEKARAWRAALCGNAEFIAAQNLSIAETSRLALAGETSDRADRAAASVEKRRRLTSLFTRTSNCLNLFANYMSNESLGEGRVSLTRDTLIAIYPAVTDRLSISRALAGYLRHCAGCSAEEAALVCDACATAAQAKPQQGTIVLSTNILDILTVGESCSYQSCHALAGCHCCGPQQYLYDPHTIVSYYYQESRPYDIAASPVALPYKVQRQMVYVDANYQAAAIQKNYGRTLPDSLTLTLRREIARLLYRLSGKPDSEPHWKIATTPADASILAGARLAYRDSTECYVSLSGDRPSIRLADHVPCLGCADYDPHRPGDLLCSSCLNDPLYVCAGCEGELDEDTVRTSDSGDTYCEECYNTRFDICTVCHEEMSTDESYGSDDGNSYCESCYNDSYIRCEHCQVEVPIEDAIRCPDDRYYCERCADELFPECEGCSERTDADNLDSNGCCAACANLACAECGDSYPPDELSDGSDVPDTEKNCPACVAAQRHRFMLCQRLIRSPKFVRASVWNALYDPDSLADVEPIIAQWADKSRVETNRNYASRTLYPLTLESMQ